MLQIKFGETIPITRQLEDPSDSGTNYVRAYIYKFRGSDAGSLLDTKNLTDKGSQRFEITYEVPVDTNDYFLQVIIKVFTDSGYTTESNRYERGQSIYLVTQRWGLQFGHGGGVEVDYKKIQKMISDTIGGIPKSEKQKETDLSPVMGTIKSAIREIIEGIKIPQQKEVDLRQIVKGLADIKNEIRNIPQPKSVDFFPLYKRLDTLAEGLVDGLTEIKTDIKDALKRSQIIEEKTSTLKEKIGQELEDILARESREKQTNKRFIFGV